LALSLADSIKDTLAFERQQAALSAANIAAGEFAPVSELPAAWSSWAAGWSYYKPVALFETAGIERRSEPVDLAVRFRADQTADPGREVRVACVDARAGELREIPSQTYDHARQGNEHSLRLMFLADVPLHDRALYLIFYGNPNAELPRYTTDLVTTGEGYGLDIENAHYVARLSRQVGQLERLTYKRQHGLELYAGGKGHGEPPGIDWAHDYVDPGHFQKFRMRNWAECRNYEIVKGPLCVRVRRWGFPHSPIHPVYTPSRMHIDQTYIFYSGLPYFIKQGQMDMVRDFDIEAMRDDEWVFSGYSFTDKLWIDGQGRVHTGEVPAQHKNNLWGVGFYHNVSRDAFVALRLDHSAENFDGIQHGGEPILHYDGHGQLWSRYPAEQTHFQTGVSIQQKNAYAVSPYFETDGARQLEQLRQQLLHPPEARFEKLTHLPAVRPIATLARSGETDDSTAIKSSIWKALNEVRDEQLYSLKGGIVDLGYVYDVRVRDGIATIVVTMPHRGRPVYQFLVTQGGGRVEAGIRERVLKLRGIRDVVVECTWDPPWSTARLSNAARRELGLPV
jgi:metal-sulfur cluster biosynthetic enzyme